MKMRKKVTYQILIVMASISVTACVRSSKVLMTSTFLKDDKVARSLVLPRDEKSFNYWVRVCDVDPKTKDSLATTKCKDTVVVEGVQR